MKLSDKKIDMLKGPLAKSIFLFTIPIAVGSIIQQLFNSADTWVVGFFSSSNALAAVGTNAEIIAMIDRIVGAFGGCQHRRRQMYRQG